MMAKFTEAIGGARSALPIAVAYLPVAFAIGAASSRLGFSAVESAFWSLVLFSGANQALMLSAIASGVPLLIVVILCIAASLRHLLYGIAINRRIAARPLAKAVFAYGLTDEVFATALASSKNDRKLKGLWLIGLTGMALSAWVVGTALGCAVGDILQASSPRLAETLDFALPALFLALVWSTVHRSLLVSMVVAAGLSGSMVIAGWPALAVPIGALAAFLPLGRSR